MKWVLLVLVLVAGAALAEEQQQEEVEEGRLFLKTFSGLKAAKTTFLGVLASGFSVATQIVSMIALIFLIVTLKNAKEALDYPDYEYYYAPSHNHGGYDQGSGSSSYASGYSKRSADFPSFLNLPIIQRLTEKVHSAIELYSEMQH